MHLITRAPPKSPTYCTLNYEYSIQTNITYHTKLICINNLFSTVLCYNSQYMVSHDIYYNTFHGNKQSMRQQSVKLNSS